MRKFNLPAAFSKYTIYIACIGVLFMSCKKTDKNFSLPYVDGLTEIELSQNERVTSLLKAGDVWMVDSVHNAGEEQIDMLLYILNTQHVTTQLPADELSAASATLAKEGVTIKAYEGKKAVLDITVATNDIYGYFGRAEKNKELYRLNLPDVNDNPLSFLSVSPSFWNHNAIITALPSDISMVTVDNLENPEKSFRISRQVDGSLSLFDTYNNVEAANINQHKLNTYVSYYTGLSYERILDLSTTDQQAILLSDSPYRLSIALKDGQQVNLQLFYITDNENLDAYGNALEYDPNVFYLSMNDRDIALAKWVDFDLLLRDLTYFVEN